MIGMDELKAESLKLLREDEEFRYAIAGYIGFNEILARLEEHEEILVRHDEEIAKLREDMNKGFMLLERHISALGAKWGLMSEGAFREGLRGLIERVWFYS